MLSRPDARRNRCPQVYWVPRAI